MHSDLIDFLACPRDRSFPLELSDAPSNAQQILAGKLRCPAHGHVISIEAGIPRFVQVQSLGELQRHEVKMRDQEAHRTRTFRLAVSDLAEYDAVRSALGDCGRLRALDVGCGSGKMSHALGSPARLVGVDFSLAALLKFRFPGVLLDLVQSEGSQMPFREACFDVALSTQVLEHLTSKDLRVKFLREIGRALKPGGKLVLTVYNWNLYSQHSKEPQEGFHESGIFYHMYLVEELRSELEEMFEVETIQGVKTILPKTYRIVQALGRKSIYWERMWRKSRLALQYGHLLLAVGHRRA
jgi:SAM-dependent methyltransferase